MSWNSSVYVSCEVNRNVLLTGVEMCLICLPLQLCQLQKMRRRMSSAVSAVFIAMKAS